MFPVSGPRGGKGGRVEGGGRKKSRISCHLSTVSKCIHRKVKNEQRKDRENPFILKEQQTSH
jgi:hypothetical protein